MAELEKIVRVLKKMDPDAPHSVILALDATTGQNALNQVEIFSQKCGVTGHCDEQARWHRARRHSRRHRRETQIACARHWRGGRARTTCNRLTPPNLPEP